jgi:hypothetical protein
MFYRILGFITVVAILAPVALGAVGLLGGING